MYGLLLRPPSPRRRGTCDLHNLVMPWFLDWCDPGGDFICHIPICTLESCTFADMGCRSSVVLPVSPPIARHEDSPQMLTAELSHPVEDATITRALAHAGRLDKLVDSQRDVSVKSMDLDTYQQLVVKSLSDTTTKVQQAIDTGLAEGGLVQMLLSLPQMFSECPFTNESVVYTKQQMHTLLLKIARLLRLLSGTASDEERRAWIDRFSKQDTITAEDVARFDSRLNVFLDRTSEVLTHLWQNCISPKFVPEGTIALVIYTADLKLCDCQDLASCEALQYNEKVTMSPPHQKTNPTPKNVEAHGYNSDLWAVTNWCNRVGYDAATQPMVKEAALATLALLVDYEDTLDVMLYVLPSEPALVFRGIPVDAAASFRPDSKIIFSACTSTSSSGSEALKFMDQAKAGTFFMLRVLEAKPVEFCSWYPEEREALLARNSVFRLSSKISRTVLTMLNCKYDIVLMMEQRRVPPSDAMLTRFIIEGQRYTLFIYENFLRGYVPCHVLLEGDEQHNKTLLQKAVEDWIKNQTDTKRLVLTGPGGSGKTTATIATLSTYSLMTGLEKPIVPLFVSLPAITGLFTTAGALDEYCRLALQLSTNGMEELVQMAEVVLLLDSLDECSGATDPPALAGFLTHNPWASTVKIVLSCRTEYIEATKLHPSCFLEPHSRAKTQVLHLQPFSQSDVEAYVHRSCCPSDVWSKVIHTVSVNAQFCSPLLLSMRTELGQDGCGSDFEVYDAYLAKREGVALLQAVAFEMFRRGAWVMPLKDVLAMDGVTKDLLYSDLVRVEDLGNIHSMVSWRHRSIAEHLAARELVKQTDVKAVARRQSPFFGYPVLLNIVLMGPEVPRHARDGALESILHDCLHPCASVFAALEDDLKQATAELGERSERVSNILFNLSYTHRMSGNHRREKELIEKACAIRRDLFGEDIRTAQALKALGDACSSLSEDTQARDALDESYQIKLLHEPKNSFSIALTMRSLALANGVIGDHQRQLELQEQALKITLREHGEKHWQFGIDMKNLAIAQGAVGDHAGEKALLEKAVPILEETTGTTDIRTLRATISLACSLTPSADESRSLAPYAFSPPDCPDARLATLSWCMVQLKAKSFHAVAQRTAWIAALLGSVLGVHQIPSFDGKSPLALCETLLKDDLKECNGDHIRGFATIELLQLRPAENQSHGATSKWQAEVTAAMYRWLAQIN